MWKRTRIFISKLRSLTINFTVSFKIHHLFDIVASRRAFMVSERMMQRSEFPMSCHGNMTGLQRSLAVGTKNPCHSRQMPTGVNRKSSGYPGVT